jgi:hypothetical protein
MFTSINMNLGSGILQAHGRKDAVRCSFVTGSRVEQGVSNMFGLACGWRMRGLSIPRGAIGPNRSIEGSRANNNACHQSPYVGGK